jgi:hypothetical protein
MNILCKMFGHQIGTGYKNSIGEKYLSVGGGPVDGIGRVHASIHTDCARCGELFKLGNIHLPILDDWVADLLKRDRKGVGK